MKKVKVKRENLQTVEDIQSVVGDIIHEHIFPTGNPLYDELSILMLYFNEMESGGHEALLTWTSDNIKQYNFERYVKTLATILEKIGAGQYAAIELQYAPRYWPLYHRLKAGEIEEERFYAIIEAADKAYYALNGKLTICISNYLNRIYTELIQVVE